MSYLKNQTIASAPALFVICRYLAHHPVGVTMDRLHKALAPAAVVAEGGRAGRTADVPPVLPHSLALGVDIGILHVEGARDQRVWTLRKEYVKLVRETPSADSRAFRSLLLRRFGARALQSVEDGENPPDVPFALTWLLTLDPLQPMSLVWDQGPREAFEHASMRWAVDNPEQWRPFLRWARALRLVNLTTSGSKARVSVDPTRAIEDVLDQLPQHASAPEWFDRLYTVLPVLGDPRLVNALPTRLSIPPGPSAAAALALSKLEHTRRVRLVAADDAADAVVLRLGGQMRRVARIDVVEENA